MEPALAEQITRAVESGQAIKVRLYALLNSAEEELNFIVSTILGKYGKEGFLSPLYTSVKELALNGAKANIKRILFSELGIDLDNEQDYLRGMAEFRRRLNEHWVFEYATKAREKDLYVEVMFNFNDERIIVEVINNSALSKKEDIRIREKFAKGSQFDNIAEFYLATLDNAEGAGMGITLILMLLKAEGIDPHLFTIRSDYSSRTVARLEFPLHENYRNSRQVFAESQS